MSVIPPSSRPDAPKAQRAWAVLVAILIAGGAVAFFTQKLMLMSVRYQIACVMGLGFLSLCMIFIRRLPEILLYLMVFSIPFMTFEKTFFLRDTWVDFGTPGINIGLYDILLAGIYVTWLVEIVIIRSQPIPKFKLLDGLVLGVVLANLLSVLTSASMHYSLFELFRVTKYALGYYYIAHRMERRHLRGVLWALMFALAFESGLGVVQHRFHKLVGIGRSKGAVTAELSMQYEVPEFEGHRRAEGTTIDSHAYGIYMVALLMFPFCLALARWVRARDRLIFAGLFFIGIPGLIASFSRGAWGAFVLAVVVVIAVFYLWKERQVLGMFLLLCLLAFPAGLIGGGTLLGKRVFRAPWEIMEARWDTLITGCEIWTQHIWTGGGANAYFHAQRDLGKIYELSNDKPAHNLVVYMLSQTGVFGLVAYGALGLAVIVYCIKLMKRKDPLLSVLALAILAGLLAIQADGMIDFMSVTNQVYFLQALLCGLVAAMLRFVKAEPAGQFVKLETWS